MSVDAVNPRPAVLLGGERIAQRVDDFAFGDAARGNLPQLLDAHAVGLRVVRVFEAEMRSMSCFAQLPRVPSAENGDLGAQVVARLEVGLRLALLVDSLVICAHADARVSTSRLSSSYSSS